MYKVVHTLFSASLATQSKKARDEATIIFEKGNEYANNHFILYIQRSQGKPVTMKEDKSEEQSEKCFYYLYCVEWSKFVQEI